MRHLNLLRTTRALTAAAVFMAVLMSVTCVALTQTPSAEAAGPVLPIPDTLWKPAVGVTPATGNYVYLESQPGDFIGQGKTYLYTPLDAVLTVTVTDGHLRIHVDGDEWWYGDFQTMSDLPAFWVGYYPGLTRYPFNDPAIGGLDWSGEGRGGNTLTGWFAVDEATYTDGVLTSIDLRFEQHSEGKIPALYGAIHWDAADTTEPPGPVTPIPDTLWKPAPGTTPVAGNYVYLDSDEGEPLGGGETHCFTQANSKITVAADGARLSVAIDEDEWWRSTFRTMCSVDTLETGYYGGLQGEAFGNPTLGGITFSAHGSSGTTNEGWVAIDGVTYADGELTAIDLRFTLASDGSPTLRGAIHWTADDPTEPPGPVTPIPDTLWNAAVSATGNYVYLDSEPGDWVGQGQDYLYTPPNAQLTVTVDGGHLRVAVNGDEWWYGDFQTMYSLDDLQPGYYGGVGDYPFHNPAKGGLSWSGEGRAGDGGGWFAIDSVTYEGGVLTAVDVRFEQPFGGASLHGAIHWSADDTSSVPGPVTPIPDSLWKPAAGATPAASDYVYLKSDMGDYVGQGGTYLYTPSDAAIGLTANGGHLTVLVNDGDVSWRGEFQTMSSVSLLEAGYYPDLQRYAFHNPAKGGLAWSGDGRGSNTLTGWFVVDSATYDGKQLSSIRLRFEQYGDGSGAALHGAIRWDVRTRLSLTPLASCRYGSATLQGLAKDAYGQPLAAVNVWVECLVAGAWTPLGSVKTGSTGAYSFGVAPTQATTYRAVFSGATGHAGATSKSICVRPRVLLTKPMGPAARALRAFTCTSYLKPHHAAGGHPIVFQCQLRVSGHWVTKKIVKAGADDYEDYTVCSAALRLGKGRWRIRAVHAADALNARTTSRWLSLTLR